jgi:hypothetical protein
VIFKSLTGIEDIENDIGELQTSKRVANLKKKIDSAEVTCHTFPQNIKKIN